MKKSLLYSLFALAGFAFASCDGNYDDWASPQHNDPENAITIPGFSATATEAVDLANAGETVKLFTLSEATLPENTTLEKTRIILKPADEASALKNEETELTATNSGEVETADLQTTINTVYGKKPLAREFKCHVYSDVMANGQAMLVDAGEISVVATPKAPFISSAYYFIGNVNGWTTDVNELVKYKFSHSDADVYDDPVFTYMVKTTEADQYWKIVPQENIDANDVFAQGVLGVKENGSTDTEGSLVTDNPQAGKFAEPGTYVVTLNMLDYTYSIVKVDSYYMVGGVYGWNAEAASKLAFYCEGGSKASITTQWIGDANLKIWNRDNIGNWDAAWGSVKDGESAAEGDLVNSGANAFVCPEKGAYYTLTIDMAAKKYSWTKLDNQGPKAFSTVSIIGGFNSWNGDVDMAQTAPHNWYLRHSFSEGTEMKFRSNHNWDSDNWGGKAKSLANMIYAEETGGDNINVPAGTYDIYFNDITGKFMFVKAN